MYFSKRGKSREGKCGAREFRGEWRPAAVSVEERAG